MTTLFELVVDPVCPWCWVGLRRLRAALDQLNDGSDLIVLLRPFELDPGIPAEGVDYRNYMQQRFPPEEGESRSARLDTATSLLQMIGEAEGIDFRFAYIERRPNTHNAHRLMRWAQGQGLALDAAEALFAAFFNEGRDIGSTPVLQDIGASLGLERDVLASLLASDADSDAVKADARDMIALGVRGVPILIGQRRYALQGAQPVETVARFLRDVMAGPVSA